MGPTAREIEQHIAQERGALGQDIEIIASRVRSAFDWRLQVRKRPLAAVGLAMGAGLLTGWIMKSDRRSARTPSRMYVVPAQPAPGSGKLGKILLGAGAHLATALIASTVRGRKS